MVLRRTVAALVAAAVLLVPSVATAQTGATAAHAAARTYTSQEVLDMAGLLPVSRGVGWGSLVRFAGTMAIAGTLVYSALDWFYDQAQQSTGTFLDEWEDPNAPMPSGAWNLGSGKTARPENRATLTDYSAFVDPVANGVYCQASGGCVPMLNYFCSGGNCSGTVYMGRSDNISSIGFSQGFSGAPDAAMAEALFTSVWLDYLEALDIYASLQQVLTAHPESASAVATQVMPQYVDHLRDSQATWPYTYGEPYGPGAGIEITPAPNKNQWYDNPYADPTIDTDGDGFSDWEEWIAGTNPNNPNEYPTTHPGGGPDTDGDGWSDDDEAGAGTDPNDPDDHPAGAPVPVPDVDGDGVPDQYDPCPFQASNACADDGGADEEIEIPDDYAREPTLSQVLTKTTEIAESNERTADAAEEILEELRQPVDTVMVFAEPEPFAQPDLSALEAWTPDVSAARVAFESAVGEVEDELSGVVASAEGKFPFGLFAIVADVPTFSGGGDCVIVPLEIMDASANINLCQTPLDGFLTGTVRPVLAALLTVGLAWTVVRLLVTA